MYGRIPRAIGAVTDGATELPNNADVVRSQRRSFVFTRDARDIIIGLGLWSGRVRNVRFTKEK